MMMGKSSILTRYSLALALLLLVLGTSGCLLLLGAAGGAAGAKYVGGKLEADMNAPVQKVHQATEKGLEIAYLVDSQAPPAIVGDVTRLRQVLINLLNNAVKFTEHGEVVVEVTSKQVGESASEQGVIADHELHFSVRDTGIGIAPHLMDRLFQAFSQVDASTTRKYGGTGLGLVISKRLCELMDGTMWVESELGVGSTFHFSIQAQVAQAPVQPYLREHQPDLSGKRVLIVDDNATNRRILTAQSKAWGMEPVETAFPAQALEWIRRGTYAFDLALLDLQMPEMDGLMLAAEIRRHERTVREGFAFAGVMDGSAPPRAIDPERPGQGRVDRAQCLRQCVLWL